MSEYSEMVHNTCGRKVTSKEDDDLLSAFGEFRGHRSVLWCEHCRERTYNNFRFEPVQQEAQP